MTYAKYATYHGQFNSGYSKAIRHYQTQKNYFLKQLEAGSNQGVQDFLKKVQTELDSSSGDTNNFFTEIYREVFDKVRFAFTQYLDSGHTEEFVQLYNLTQQKKEEKENNKTQVARSLRSKIEQVLSGMGIMNDKTDNANNFAFNLLKDKSLTLAKNSDIQNNIYGYARRVILEQLWGEVNLNGPSISYFLSSMKGYAKEEALAAAFSKVFQDYQIKLQAASAGAERFDNIQISQDIILGSNITGDDGKVFSEIIQKLQAVDGVQEATFPISIEKEREMITSIFATAQSKSWAVPWQAKKIDVTGWKNSFGGNSQYLPKPEQMHSWHAGAANVMANIIDIIGPTNLIYATGDNIYFTCDLLAQFRDASYVLSYYKDMKADTLINRIVMAKHDDSVTRFDS